MKILVSGSTGFIGKVLVERLIESNHKVYILVRDQKRAESLFSGLDQTNLHYILWPSFNEHFKLKEKSIDAVINLIGDNLSAKRWTNERKKEIYNSRVDATKCLFQNLKRLKINVNKFISTSAIGVYQKNLDTVITEEGKYAQDFLSNLCQNWEEEVIKHNSQYKEHTIFRLGVVLGKNGGMMQKILPIFRRGFGGKLGNGKQVLSWIHVHDLVSLFIKSAEDSNYSGVINATSPHYIDNEGFTHLLGKYLRKPTSFTVPRFVLKIMMGEMSEIALDSQKVVSQKLKEQKFHYRYPTIELALKEVVSK